MKIAYYFLVICAFFALAIVTIELFSGSESMPEGEFPPALSPAPEASIKVINYNTWHGLGGSGVLKRTVLEPSGRKALRVQEQLELLKEAKPDLLFLQELNPVTTLSKEIAAKLGMSHVFQVTNCGISIGGVGIPSNLTMGIAILARPPWKIQKIKGVKLSGTIGACNPYVTFQYSEFRYALFASARHPRYGDFLLVNAHLHHGVQMSPLVQQKINQWEAEGVLNSSQRAQLESAIEKAGNRRMKEVRALFSKLGRLQKKFGNIPVILAGDFNSTFSSPVYREIVEVHKMIDAAGNYASGLYTWDPVNNEKNHGYTGKFGFTVPTFDKQEVKDFFKKYGRRQRRIDYIFMGSTPWALTHSLFANRANSEGLIGSDHFGVSSLIRLPEKGVNPQKK